MKPSAIDAKLLLQEEWDAPQVTVTAQKATLYALGIGASQDPMNESDLDFTCELSENFKVFPTITTTLTQAFDYYMAIQNSQAMPVFNPMTMVHAEHYCYNYLPIQLEEPITNKARISDVSDLGKHAIITVEYSYYNQRNEMVSKQEFSLIFKKLGGFGHKGSRKALRTPPDREPDSIVLEKTVPNQALLYRLCGDFNPLHALPAFASDADYSKPILHGLCFYGIAAKIILQQYCNYDPNMLLSFGARFTSHVYPGETLQIESWNEGHEILFQMRTVERGDVVQVGRMELRQPPDSKLQ